jgi:hypothetical protein
MDEGLILLEGYILDAFSVMEISKDWYDFELSDTKQYNLPMKLKTISEIYPTS